MLDQNRQYQTLRSDCTDFCTIQVLLKSVRMKVVTFLFKVKIGMFFSDLPISSHASRDQYTVGDNRKETAFMILPSRIQIGRDAVGTGKMLI